jgi:tetratricopeptide (TPR) repeat protein
VNILRDVEVICRQQRWFSAFLVCTLGSPLIGAAAQDGLEAQIAQSEVTFFGKSSIELPAQRRLDRLERGIFGKPRKGTLAQRLQKLKQALGETQNSKSSGHAGPSNSVSEPENQTADQLPATEERQSTQAKEAAQGVNRPAESAKDKQSAQDGLTAQSETAQASRQNSIMPELDNAQGKETVQGRRGGYDSSMPDFAKAKAREVTELKAEQPVQASQKRKSKALEAKPHQTTAHETKTAQRKQTSAKEQAALSQPSAETAHRDQIPSVAPKAVLNTKELLQLGAQRFKEGNALQADAAFRKVLVHDPENADALFNLGALQEGRGDYVSALGLYTSAQRVKPNDGEIKSAVQSMQDRFSNKRALDSTTPLFSRHLAVFQ